MTATIATADHRTVLATHGSTFHHATRLLGRRHALRATRLYSWCRRVDDVADDAGGDPGARHAAALRLANLRAALVADDRRDPLAAEVLVLCDEVGADPAHAVALVDGVASDLGEVAITDERALVRYGYAVAGTVGLLMLPVLDVVDPAAQPFAVDMGVAMQLTNIARDVVVDARMGRRYLPGTWVEGLAPAELLDPSPHDAALVRFAVARTLQLAEVHYASAEVGLAHLPPRPRAAIAVAGRVYRRIGRRLARADHDVWAGRTTVPPAVKGAVTLGALGRQLVGVPPGPHDTALHRHLVDLPGVAVEGHRARAT